MKQKHLSRRTQANSSSPAPRRLRFWLCNLHPSLLLSQAHQLLPALRSTASFFFIFHFFYPIGSYPCRCNCLVKQHTALPAKTVITINTQPWERLIGEKPCLFWDDKFTNSPWWEQEEPDKSKLLTCDEVSDEERLIFLVIFQHPLEIFLLPLDSNLPVTLVLSPLLRDHGLVCCKEKGGWNEGET